MKGRHRYWIRIGVALTCHAWWMVCAHNVAFSETALSPGEIRIDDSEIEEQLPDPLPRAEPSDSTDQVFAEPRSPFSAEPIPRGNFPALPPPPEQQHDEPLPPLIDELWYHGGSYLYTPEGDRLNWPSEDSCAHFQVLRLPECWQKPKPVTLFSEFLGADPIQLDPHAKWPGCRGYSWEPRFVLYGAYELFGLAFEENNRRQDVVGHQLLMDLDLRLTGTERFHVQFRPLGDNRSGGSYFQFSHPSGYVDNLQSAPDRYWFEGELHSIFSSWLNPFAVADYHVVAGKFPFQLHNNLLINDDILGVVVNKNTIFCGPLSNLNVQCFAATDVETLPNSDAQLYGTHWTADWHRTFYQATYAFVSQDFDTSRNSHYFALSSTSLWGTWTITRRALFKVGDEAGRRNGRLLVVEANRTKYFCNNPMRIEYGVFYANLFRATRGWTPISGGNFNRLRASFEVNPLVTISAGRPVADTWGCALGVQLFRQHEDESLIPEIAFEAPNDQPIWGVGLRYLKKTSARSFFEILGIYNCSDSPQFRREGVFASETILL